MKRIISLLLAILIIITMTPMSVMAMGEITMSATPTNMNALHAGDKVTIKVLLPEVTTPKLQFDLVFDTDKFQYNDDVDISNVSAQLNIAKAQITTEDSSRLRLVAAGMSPVKFTSGTIAMTASFTVKESYGTVATAFRLDNLKGTTDVSLSTVPLSATILKAPITSVSATVSQPVKGHPLDTSVNVYGATTYTANVMWKDVEENMTATGDAKPGKIYTALITLKAKEGEAFSSSLHNRTTPGGYSIEWLNSTELLLTKEFDRTNVKEATGIAIDNTTLTVAVPAAQPNMEQKAELPLTAKVSYDDGTDETVDVTWSIVTNPKPEGVNIEADGKLTVTNKAAGGTVEVKAAYNGMIDKKTVTITKAAEKVTLVEIYDQVGGTPETRLLIPAGTGTKDVDYTAKVYDQYGVYMPAEMVHWALNPTTVTGVVLDDTSIPGSATLKVDNSATSGTTFKLKATTATLGTTGVKELEITVQKKKDVSSKINFNGGSLTYNGAGQKYEKAALDSSVTAGEGGTWTYTYAVKSGGTGMLDTATGLPKIVGTYTVTATYEDSSNIGSKSATLIIMPKTVKIPAADNKVYIYDGTAKTYQISASADYNVNNATQTDANEAGYTVTVALTDENNTRWENGDNIVKHYTFKIMKATPTGAPSYAKITEADKTLADAALVIGTLKPDTATYQLHWVNDSGAILANDTKVEKNQAYKWLFTPADTANYNTLTGSLTPYYVASSGGSHVSKVQKPEITIIGSGKADLSADGRTATITAAAGHELVSVVLNGKEMGKVEKLTGLKTGDKATITFRAKTDGKAEMDKMIAQKASKLTLMARSKKTAKLNIKVVVKGDLKAITDAGYTVKYKFYRSTKKSAGYKAVLTKKAPTYYNTYGKKGTMYYYKARVMIYDKDGNFVAQTALKQCKYANRLWTK